MTPEEKKSLDKLLELLEASVYGTLWQSDANRWRCLEDGLVRFSQERRKFQALPTEDPIP